MVGSLRGVGSLGGGDLATSPLTGDSDSGGSPSGDDPRGVLGACLEVMELSGPGTAAIIVARGAAPAMVVVTAVSEKACRPRRGPSARPTTERRIVYRVMATAALAGAVVKTLVHFFWTSIQFFGALTVVAVSHLRIL